ncbi:putative phospholipid-transporting atpase [Anaeramoeba ignava]|uniref:Phospholipid-transporting ATPase n=1 Tax=Anaeramoeba ignava TaxID=1746090 RepID=A0A9Q0LV54_ANAIG|nr:putative phospholipid-transporting atpase [Anaeramoeba ignava]
MKLKDENEIKDENELKDEIELENESEDKDGNEDKNEDEIEFMEIRIADRQFTAKKKYPPNFISTTKYKIWNFIFINLFEQFRRLANFYFLIVMLLSLGPWTPIDPFTSIAPLIFVLAVSAIKAALEDYKRHKADKEANKALFKIYDPISESLIDTQSKDIQVGDIIYLTDRQEIPADLIVLSTSEEDDVCYIETSNLDGETNTKIRSGLSSTSHLNSIENLKNSKGTIKCELPNDKIYRFEGQIILDSTGETNALTVSQVLLRGCSIRNTKWIFAVVVYAGIATKMFKNQRGKGYHFSKFERTLNTLVWRIFLIQFVLVIFCTFMTGFAYYKIKDAGYVNEEDALWKELLTSFATYFILLSYMIPISLYITVELVRLAQAWLMQWDQEMYSPNQRGKMTVKNSDINEELGQIQRIFSDKTGTLTENEMIFSKCSINGNIYDFSNYIKNENNKDHESIILENDEDVSKIKSEIDQNNLIYKLFFQVLALCHTVIPEKNPETEEITFQAQSPDEIALIQAAKIAGFELFERKKKTGITLKQKDGELQSYPVESILDFTSARKRMSIIVRNENNELILLTKGADNVIIERLASGQEKSIDQISNDLTQFARSGLRTLLIAYRYIEENQFQNWKIRYEQALSSLNNRQQNIDQVYRLQDGVPETIQYILESGISMWLLTGDKIETAKSVGISSKLISPDTKILTINCLEEKNSISRLEKKFNKYCKSSNQNHNLALVVTGHSLTHLLEHKKEQFIEFGEFCKSVICCRVTPKQKSQIVDLVHENSKMICLAIGDGANDVGMIQRANVGVGLFGKEGNQAALSSDFALTRFKHLQRLIFIHGRYSYLRLSGVVLYSFYKNFSFILVQFWFSFFNAWSGQSLYDDWVMTLFNVIFTSLPPLVYGFTEKDANESIIEKYPQLYHTFSIRNLFSWKKFVIRFINAIYQSLIVFFVVYGTEANNPTLRYDGLETGLAALGSYCSSYSILIVLLTYALETNYWNWITHFSLWLSIAVIFLFLLMLSNWLSVFAYEYGVLKMMLSSSSFYTLLIIVVILGLLPEYFVKYWRTNYHPYDWQILVERYKNKKLLDNGSFPKVKKVDSLNVKKNDEIEIDNL